MVGERIRLDQALVAQGLVTSRERAQTMVRAGLVRVDGHEVDQPDRLVDPTVGLELRGSSDYVSRGGEKLTAALDAFRVSVGGRACLDVGYGQLAWALRQDPRVTVLERVNIRYVERLPASVDLAVIDVSFISLRLVLPPLHRLVAIPADVIALVKPQFEVGKGAVGKGGIVRDPDQHRSVLRALSEFAAASGYEVLAETPSPILGAKGNREFFLHLRSRG